MARTMAQTTRLMLSALTVLTTLTLLTAASTLSGCGFALRGDDALPAQWMRVHIIGADDELIAALRREMIQRGAHLQSSNAANTATATIQIAAADFTQRNLGGDAGGRATADELEYRVRFHFIAADGVMVQRNQTITVQRAFAHQPRAQLRAEAERRAARNEMRFDAARRIVRRLSAAK